MKGNRAIPADAICFFLDGTKWMCVRADFQNLQLSPAGFGDDFNEAFAGLHRAELAETLKKLHK